MNVDKILYTIQGITANFGKNVNWTVEQVNYYFSLANVDLFNYFYGNLYDKEGAETQQLSQDALKPFKTSGDVSLTAGVGSLPADYVHAISPACHTSDSTIYRVDIVTDKEWVARQSNSVTAPSTTYPIARIYGSSVAVKPTTISTLTLHYYKRPTEPVYAATLSNGVMTYASGSSTQFDWDELFHPRLIKIILGYIGITVPESFIVDYVEQQQDKGK